MKKKMIGVLFGLSAFALSPSIAYAYGNPLILYGFVSIAVFHFIIAILIFTLKKLSGYRVPLFTVFTANTVVSWLWASGYKGAAFWQMYLGLACGPAITFACMYWVVLRTASNHR